MSEYLKVTVAIIGASALALAAGWYAIPHTPRNVQMFAFEIITIASNVIDPCPSDEILTATFEEKKSDLKELSDLIRKEPWSSNASETGREIVRQKSDMIISMDPWQVKESEETTSLVLSKEK